MRVLNPLPSGVMGSLPSLRRCNRSSLFRILRLRFDSNNCLSSNILSLFVKLRSYFSLTTTPQVVHVKPQDFLGLFKAN
jgi:hypothetical protein